jgi:hypothetical protein
VGAAYRRRQKNSFLTASGSVHIALSTVPSFLSPSAAPPSVIYHIIVTATPTNAQRRHVLYLRFALERPILLRAKLRDPMTISMHSRGVSTATSHNDPSVISCTGFPWNKGPKIWALDWSSFRCTLPTSACFRGLIAKSSIVKLDLEPIFS